MEFNKLIGNEKIKENLIKILKNKTISHSYMFIGTKGIGKKEFAKEFARGILCTSNENKPCKECKSCIEFVNNNNPDYYEIGLEEDEKSIKIDTIRLMQNKVQELPIVSDVQIDNIETSSFNYQNNKHDSYKVTVSITYQKDLGYPSKYKLTLIKNDKYLQVVASE